MYIRPPTSATSPRACGCGFPELAEDHASFAFHVSRIPPMYKAVVVLDSPSEKAVGAGGFFPKLLEYYYYYY